MQCGVPDFACDVNKLYYIYYLYLLSFFSATLDFCNVLAPVGVVHSNLDIDILVICVCTRYMYLLYVLVVCTSCMY